MQHDGEKMRRRKETLEEGYKNKKKLMECRFSSEEASSRGIL